MLHHCLIVTSNIQKNVSHRLCRHVSDMSSVYIHPNFLMPSNNGLLVISIKQKSFAQISHGCHVVTYHKNMTIIKVTYFSDSLPYKDQDPILSDESVIPISKDTTTAKLVLLMALN